MGRADPDSAQSENEGRGIAGMNIDEWTDRSRGEDGCFSWDDAIDLQAAEDIEEEAIQIARGLYLTDSGTEDREQFGPLAPGARFVIGWSAPPLEQISDEILLAMAHLASRAADPLVRARLSDILWITRFGEHPHLSLVSAQFDYLLVASDARYSDLDRLHYATRAHELLRATKGDGISTIVEIAWGIGSAALEQVKTKPGVLFRAADLGIAAGDVDRFSKLLETVLQAQASDPWITESCCERLLKVYPTGSDSYVRVSTCLVDSWVDHANRSEPFQQLTFLQKAYACAERYSLGDKSKAIRVQLDSVEEPKFEAVASTSEVPSEVQEFFRSSLAGATTIPELLDRLAVLPFLHQGREQTALEVEESRRHNPLQFIIPNSVIKYDRIEVWRAETREAIFDLTVVQAEVRSITNVASLVLSAMDDLALKESLANSTDQVEAIPAGQVDDSCSADVQIAVDLWLEGRTLPAVCLMLPSIERTIRNLASKLQIPVVKPPRGQVPGGVRALGVILEDLSERAATNEDETLGGLTLYWQHALTNALSLNIRNEYLHGLRPVATDSDFVILLHIVAQLRLLSLLPTEPSQQPSQQPSRSRSG